MPENVAKYWPILAAVLGVSGVGSSFIVTRSEAEALAELAGARAKLEATQEALGACMATVDKLTPKESP